MGQSVKDTWRCGGVAPEDEHGGHDGGEGVRSGQGLEERDSGLREAVHEDREFVAAEDLRVLIRFRHAFRWVWWSCCG